MHKAACAALFDSACWGAIVVCAAAPSYAALYGRRALVRAHWSVATMAQSTAHHHGSYPEHVFMNLRTLKQKVKGNIILR